MTSSALALAPPAPGDAPEPARWSLARRIAFRFLVVYAIAFTFPFPLDAIPKCDEYAEKVWNAISAGDAWVAREVLGLSVAPEFLDSNGSGDRLVDWVHLLVLLVVATTGAAVWSVLDRRRPHYERAARWLRTTLRYYLAYVMMSYGLSKVFKTQFPFPWEGDLAMPFGEKSPMGVLWSFMGYSTPYNVFTGAAEVLGGVLLLTRRTTTLGALVIIGVMSNVVMLNFSYDVPVKIFSTHLLAAAMYLAAPDLRRLANLLVLNQPAPAVDLGPKLSRPWLTVKLAAIGVLTYGQLDSHIDRYHRGPGKPKPALAGVWDVTSMKRNGVELAPLDTDKDRWRRLMVTSYGTNVEGMDPELGAWHEMTFDRATSVMTLRGRRQVQPWVLHAVRDGDELRLEGFYDLAPVEIILKKREFLLETRGFHWVNDYPYNR
jgi:uncharacterized membrane protein YphA (DoxX/SURF4 family)